MRLKNFFSKPSTDRFLAKQLFSAPTTNFTLDTDSLLVGRFERGMINYTSFLRILLSPSVAVNERQKGGGRDGSREGGGEHARRETEREREGERMRES